MTTNTWDGENRLTNVALPDGVLNTMTYNGDGQRVQKQDSTGTTNHVWDGQNILLETNASNIIQAVYTLDQLFYGDLISQSRGGIDSFYLFDSTDSTRQLSGVAGTATSVYLYDSWGSALQELGDSSTFLYHGRQGYYFDPDYGVYYIRARYYSPSTGRFLSRDPLRYPTDSVGPYVYCSNSPTMQSDPSGLLCNPAALPPDPPSSCCNQFLAAFTLTTTCTTVAGHLRTMGCPPLKMSCVPCAVSCKAYGVTIGSNVFVCSNWATAAGLRASHSIYRTLVHELNHTRANCLGSASLLWSSDPLPSPTSCFGILIDEVLTHVCAGECSGLDIYRCVGVILRSREDSGECNVNNNLASGQFHQLVRAAAALYKSPGKFCVPAYDPAADKAFSSNYTLCCLKKSGIPLVP